LHTLCANLAKEKPHVLLAPWCTAAGLPVPWVSTIGRIIACAPDKMRLCPHQRDAHGGPKPVRHHLKSRQSKQVTIPWSYLAVNTVERARDG
jgi:hypothetical protein